MDGFDAFVTSKASTYLVSLDSVAKRFMRSEWQKTLHICLLIADYFLWASLAICEFLISALTSPADMWSKLLQLIHQFGSIVKAEVQLTWERSNSTTKLVVAASVPCTLLVLHALSSLVRHSRARQIEKRKEHEMIEVAAGRKQRMDEYQRTLEERVKERQAEAEKQRKELRTKQEQYQQEEARSEREWTKTLRPRRQKQRQELLTMTHREKSKPSESDKRSYEQWREKCSLVLKKKHRMVGFPNPPSWPCTECSFEYRTLKTCVHSVKRLLKASGSYEQTLKFEQKRWHPEEFHQCKPEVRDQMMKRATEFSQHIDALIEEIKQEKRGRNFSNSA